jgi:hypothetical protein
LNQLFAAVIALSMAQSPMPKTKAQPSVPKVSKSTKNSGSKKEAQPAVKRTKPRTKNTKVPPRMAPEACRKIIDNLVSTLEAPLKPLMAEARLGDKKDLERGAHAFRAKLNKTRSDITRLRNEAIALQKTLGSEQITRCEGYAYTAFHRLLTRFSAAAGAYRGQPSVLRALGALFESSPESQSR